MRGMGSQTEWKRRGGALNPVAHTIQDVLNGTDPELARALALARSDVARH